MTSLRLVGPGQPGDLVVKDDELMHFQISSSKSNPEGFDISRFVSNASLEFEQSANQVIYEIGITPFSSEVADGMRAIDRRIAIEADGERENFSIKTEPTVRPGQTFECRPLNLAFSNNEAVATVDQPYISLVLTVTPPHLVSYDYINNPDTLLITGLNGWVTARDLGKDDIDGVITPGSIGMVSMTGSHTQIIIGNQEFPPRHADQIQVHGKLRGTSDGGSITFDGNGSAVFLNGDRANRTRWEQLDAGVRIPLLLGLPTAFVFLYNLFMRIVRRKDAVWTWS